MMAVGWLFAYLGVLLWAGQPQHSDRWLVVTDATIMGVIVFMANLIARAVGWWGYSLPFILQAGLLLLGPSVWFTFLLTGYRWLAAHSRRPLLIYGVIVIIVLVPLTVVGDIYSTSVENYRLVAATRSGKM